MFDDPVERRLRQAPLRLLDAAAETRIHAALAQAGRRGPRPGFTLRVAASILAGALAAWALRSPHDAGRAAPPEPVIVNVSLDRPLFSRAHRAGRLNILNWR